jgi:hypothetical protein
MSPVLSAEDGERVGRYKPLNFESVEAKAASLSAVLQDFKRISRIFRSATHEGEQVSREFWTALRSAVVIAQDHALTSTSTPSLTAPLVDRILDSLESIFDENSVSGSRGTAMVRYPILCSIEQLLMLG